MGKGSVMGRRLRTVRGVALCLTMAVLTAVTLTAATGSQAYAQGGTRYQYVDLGVIGVPREGDLYQSSVAWAVNGSGQVTGDSTISQASYATRHAFRWTNGTMTDLGALYTSPSGLSFSAGSGINDAGDVAGSTWVNSTEPPHAFVYSNGVMTDLGTGYGTGSRSNATDLNDSGLVVGVHGASQQSPKRAAVWQNGVIQDIGTLGGSSSAPYSTESEANAVNDAGYVVGAALPTSGIPLHAFIWFNGVMSDLGTLGGNGEATRAYGINNANQIVGASPNAAGQVHAFRWTNGVMLDLGTLGGSSSIGNDINANGEVVGISLVAGNGAYRPFIWRNGQLNDLNALTDNLPSGVTLYNATGINDDGVIVGNTCTTACDIGNYRSYHAYMLVPVT